MQQPGAPPGAGPPRPVFSPSASLSATMTAPPPAATLNPGVSFHPDTVPEPQALVPVPETEVATASPYTFNPVTGMLESPGSGTSGGLETRSRFVEGGPQGGFRRVPEATGGDPSGLAARRAAVLQAAAATRAGGQNTMRNAVVVAQSIIAASGLFAQGLLAGVCVLNLFMTYFLDAANISSLTSDSGFLHYYSPIAVTCQRIYVSLSAISLIASVDKYSRESLSGFMLQGFTLQKIDALAVVSFFMCFLLSIIAVPFEDTLYYANARVPDWWLTTSASSSFTGELSTYHGVNCSRVIFGMLGYLCTCYTATPAVLDVVQRAEDLSRTPMKDFQGGGFASAMKNDQRFGGHVSASVVRKSNGFVATGSQSEQARPKQSFAPSPSFQR